MKPFEVIGKDGIYAVKSIDSCVVILPYTLDEKGAIDKIGMVSEKNPHQLSGFYTGPIMGTLEKDDHSIISRAKKELEEESGYIVGDINRWTFLGEMIVSKNMPDPIYFYGVDVSGIDAGSPSGDGSPQEEGIEFNLVPLTDLRKSQDIIINACFFKLFINLYKNQII